MFFIYINSSMESEDPKLNFEESDNESEVADINNDTDNDSIYEDGEDIDEDDAKSDNGSETSEKDLNINDVDTMTEEANDDIVADDDVNNEDLEGSEVNNEDEDDDVEDEDEDEDEDDDDENLYLFDEDLKQNMIDNSHTLLKVSNMSEIKTLSVVTRDVNNQITDEHHKTIPILTKYEKAKILGVRGAQLNNGCKAFVDTTDADIDGYLIAERELYDKKIPFIIKRPLPSGNNEYWNVNDLELII